MTKNTPERQWENWKTGDVSFTSQEFWLDDDFFRRLSLIINHWLRGHWKLWRITGRMCSWSTVDRKHLTKCLTPAEQDSGSGKSQSLHHHFQQGTINNEVAGGQGSGSGGGSSSWLSSGLHPAAAATQSLCFWLLSPLSFRGNVFLKNCLGRINVSL